jgi:succinyl-CoA synthetase beta subunit
MQKLLNEYEAKRFLSGYGIPVVKESLATDAEIASQQATALGFPVVLKAVGEKLAHKTEVGGVVLNLRNPNEVKEEGERLLMIPGCERLLVQKMVSGLRELVCGLTRDAHFGPCVMFGLGGVFTEAIGDAVFRLAPITGWEARDMLQEIQAKKLLGPLRGESAVDVENLAQVLVCLGEIGMQHEEIQSIDINPLKIEPDGKPLVVDALVIVEEEPE